ncbi:MAG: helix-turn-helix transcriptional regulator [Candidatus Omnitrophica bacterium]|nr:helix-turn-helix transcriptional regulator [Candidatus Omnitrophota bacterium]MCM8827669.1 helix-turn-helix transcriptional regulator [Candidatus Omnitrophota bacterium]
MEKDIYKIIGASVKKVRKSAGITQEELSRKTGLDPSFISHIERGTKKASIETIFKIANALQVPLEELFSQIPRANSYKDKNFSFGKRIEMLVKDSDEEYKKILLKVAKMLSSKK